MKTLAALLALMVLSTSAFAEGEYQEPLELRLVRVITVYVRDAVKDGCLSNPNALKVEAELMLRRSGISVTDALPLPQGGYVLMLTPFGWEIAKTSGGCVATLNVRLSRVTQAPEGHRALITAYEQTYLAISGTKTMMQENLRSQVSEFISDLANEILKAQGQ